MLFASVWDSFLPRALVLLLFQYTAKLSSRVRTWFISAKWTIPEFPKKIFRSLLGISNLYQILWPPNLSLNWKFIFFEQDLPEKSMSYLKQKNLSFACVQGCYLLYQTLPHRCQQTQRYFNAFPPSSSIDSESLKHPIIC